ncbi:VWA domain-containing protein [Ruminococcus bicirculans (ex Wegman et al. 2014)]|uniref:VWA domain-containing protein n=1 Tax=Ruminococcus bicirculans (ex Wegman et al. 2014) TaxID=1160721 RepID=UPI00399958B9
MKRKLKDFLNKRVISTAISAAITFNMIAILPMSVFADDNSTNESNSKVTSFDGNRYQLFDESMSWTEAKEYCENLGGHLATITSPEEQESVESLLKSGSKNSYWLGGLKSSSEWTWLTNEDFSLFAKWTPGQPDNYLNQEDCLMMYKNTNPMSPSGTFGYWNDLNNSGNCNGEAFFGAENFGFICEWEGTTDKIEEVSPYTLFSGSSTENFQLNCWKSTFNGNVYTGAGFVSNASELYLNGKVDAVKTITTNGWQINIDERNENVEKETMPDWDARIHKMAGAYEFTDEDVVRIQDKNVIDGAVKTTGKVEISGTTFDGNCYIIADGDITYNVNDFISTGRVVLYSRNGNITINGTNIDINGIMYAPNGTVAFNSNIANINGRIFADKINFSGSIFNVTSSDSDWELLGTKSVISKTYTFDDDFNEGDFDGLGLDVADELTLNQRSYNDNVPSENSYKIDSAANGIGLTVKSDKSSLDKPKDSVNLEFDLSGFGSQEIEGNNVDLAIVVDTSGSMSGSRRTNAQNAAREVVAQMKENDRCAIIKFTSNATVLQDFTYDRDSLNSAINKLNANGGTDIASGINKAIGCFNNLEDNSRQKYIILLSDGGDSSKSAQAALDAYDLGIRIFALSIGNDSKQMQTVAANSNGIYLNSPTAEQINEMMQQFAAEVFDTAGKDISFEMTVSKKADIDIASIEPQPTEIIENEDGTKTLKWNYEKISIDETQKITVPVFVTNTESGLFNIADNVSCTYFNRNGESATVYADDIVMPVHSYKETGAWTAVYDSKTTDTVWKNIYWNGKLYDDGMIAVKACAGNDENAFGDWVDITNHADVENLSGRYVKLSVEMNVSSTGKTPELFDITVLSDDSDNVNYINNAPETKIVGLDTTCVSKRLFLSSETADDAFCTQLDFKWSCDNENVIISNSNKPYASFMFNESGEYTVTLTVSDGNSETVVSKTITVLNDENVVIPIIDIEVPTVVKIGSAVSGRINNLNGAQIAEYEVKAGNESVSTDEDGNFTFTAPENDCIIAINVKAANALGLYGESSKAIVVDGTAPSVELRSDSDEIHTNDTVTVSAVMSDENGIKDYVVTLNGEKITLNENYQYIFTPETAGKYVFVLTAEDIAGNTSDTTLVLNVSEEEIKDTNQPVVKYSVPKMLMAGESGDFRFIASDDTGVAEFTVKVNGVAVALDENGCFSYVPEKSGNLIIDVHAADEAGNNTDFQLTVPVISLDLVTEKTTFKENEIVTVQLVYSDNLNIADQQAAIDGVLMTIENDKISAEGLSVGSHQVVWQVQDECGAVFTGTLEIEVIDSTAPEVSVTLSDNNPKEGDTVTAEITVIDEYGIASVIAKLDGNEITVNESKAILENLTAGKHTIEVTATDTTGNYTVYTYDFTVLCNQLMDTIAPELDVTVEFTEDKNIEITAVATDDSGNAAITGTVNGEEVIFENGKAVYTHVGVGDYVIIVRAEDESGNYTEKTQTVTITKEDLVFELKLGVTVEKDNIKPNETTDLVVSTSSVLGEVSLSCTANGGTVTENEDGFSFVSDKTGTFEFVVTATDKKGNTVSQTVYITVTEEKIDIGDDDEETGNYENKYTPEPRARVILDSNEKTETKMTEEMADLVDHLETPLAVYEYLYNNVNTEFYKGSRKGAIGTYEQNGGNDVDCASLLIAMLRYMGYEAEYVTGTVGVTERQLINLTATDNIETALRIFMIQGKEVSKSADTYYFDHTWVKTTIDGKEYELDISFKKYKQVESISDEIEKQNIDVDISDFKDSSDFYLYLSKFDDQSSEEISVNVTGKMIVQKNISKIPLKLPYICGTIKEQVKNIYDSKIVDTDLLKIGINNGYQQVISGPKAYISTITVGYVPNKEFYSIFGDGTPSSIYNLKNDYWAQYADTISPALYIDNKIIYEWNGALTSIGKTQYLNIASVSSNETFEDTKEILVGSVNCISTDNQNISAQSLLTAYGKMPLTDEEQAKVNESNVYNDKYIGNFLSLIGTTYFTQLDIENKVLAGANRIYAERYLSYGVFSYEPCVTVSAFSKDIETKGSFSVDILGNYASTVSYRNNADDEYAYRFASGYVSSYLESLVLDELVGIGSLSTAKIFSFASSQGIEIKYISAANKGEIDSLDIYESDKSEVLSAVNNGQTVIVPEKNITFGNWTGTGYIIIDDSENSFAFKLTNGLNGAVNTDYVTADMIGANLCEILEFFFAFQALSAGAAMLATGNIVGSVVMFALTVSLAISAVTYWNDSLKLYNKAMNGDALAAAELAARTKSRCIEDFIFVALGELAEPIAKVFMKIPFVQRLIGSISGAVWELNNKVIASSELYQRYLLKQYAKEEVAKVCGYEVSKKISPELLDSIFKSGQASDIVAILSKYDDEAIVAINKILDKDAVATLIRDYGDDGVKVAVKGGNNLVGALAKLDDAALERFMGIASKQDREFFKLFENCDRFTDDLISLVNKKGGINFNEVEIHGIINTEIDEIDFATKVIYEDKNARGLYIENPDVPQTETQWANKQILKKGENRIKALSQNEFSVYIDGEEYSFLSSELKDVRSYVFRINADTPELRIAVEDCLEQLRILYPDYNFSAVYGG